MPFTSPKRLPIRVMVLVVAVFAASCTTGGSSVGPSADSNNVENRAESYAGDSPAPEFPTGLDWLNTARPLTLADVRGKVVLLDFWTYGCINCQQIIPDLKALEEEFGDALTVVGVHSAKFAAEGNTESIRQIILRYGIEHPVVNDSDFAVWKLWGAQAWPTVVVIDPVGNVVGGHAGEGIYSIFQPVIASLLQEFSGRGLVDTAPIDLRLESAGRPETVLSFPGNVLVDDAGGRLFVADTNHHRIVMADLETGEALAVFGSGEPGRIDGTPGSFSSPHGMVLSENGSTLFVADTGNHALRSVDIPTGAVMTIAGTGRQGTFPVSGGHGTETALFSPWALERDESTIWVAMAGSHQLWAFNIANGMLTPAVGSGREGITGGSWAQAELAQPSGLTLAGTRLYFADSESSSIRFADLEDQAVGLLAGSDADLFDFGSADGFGNKARFQHPLDITTSGGLAYVADTYNSRIRWIDLATGESGTLSGSEPGWLDGAQPQFSEPGGIDASADGRLFVADTNNHAVRVVDPQTGEASTFVVLGVEAVEPAIEAASFGGTLIQLAPQELAIGDVNIDVDVVLPDGYKVNPLAPSTVAWSGVGTEVNPDATGTFLDLEFPLSVAAEVRMDGSLSGELSLVYCEVETESICLLERMRVVVPVLAVEGGATHVSVEHVVELPIQ